MMRHLLFSFFSLLLCFSVNAQSIGMLGTATPGGWDTDTDMVQDAMDPDVWTLQITLIDGVCKFRQDDDWAVNWGSLDFPTGIGVQDGSDIPVFAGDYLVTFNAATGAYNFDVDSDIGIIGPATAGGWDFDTDMYIDHTDSNKYFLSTALLEGEAKFRQDDDWAVNWGSADFPTGVGTQDGDNIPVSPAGDYMINFDKSTGEYSFEEIITFTSIGIVGSATPGGWDEETDLIQSTSDANVWTVSMTLVDGEAIFQANDDSVINWGSADFPTGVGVQDGDNIPVVAGNYLINFNTETGAYSFEEIVEYSTIGIIGDATPGGWAEDTDMEQDPDDAFLWSLRVILIDGEAKFRAEDDWPVNWGSGDFPSGTGVLDGANIPIVAGEYNITFNSITGAYNFEEIVVFGTVGLIGTATPIGDWETDVDLEQSIVDEHLWALDKIELVDGEAKFRAEDDWPVNWGLDVWPAGIGVQDGPNIPITAGIWGVSINTLTGEYAFGDPMVSTQDILDPSSVKVFPNPTNSILNIDLADLNIKGDVTIKLIDMTGKVLREFSSTNTGIIRLNLEGFTVGNYLLQISNQQLIVGKKITISK